MRILTVFSLGFFLALAACDSQVAKPEFPGSKVAAPPAAPAPTAAAQACAPCCCCSQAQACQPKAEKAEAPKRAHPTPRTRVAARRHAPEAQAHYAEREYARVVTPPPYDGQVYVPPAPPVVSYASSGHVAQGGYAQGAYVQGGYAEESYASGGYAHQASYGGGGRCCTPRGPAAGRDAQGYLTWPGKAQPGPYPYY